MSRKKFIENNGATFKNWNWSWSFVNEQRRAMKPYGMSGGQLWYIPNQYVAKNEILNFYLAGILIECNLQYHRCLAASRIYKVLNLLSKASVDLGNKKYKLVHLKRRNN